MALEKQENQGLEQEFTRALHLATAGAEIGCYRTDSNGVVTHLDPALFRLLDLTGRFAGPEACVGKRLEELAAPGSLRALLTVQENQEGTLIAHDYPVLTHAGNRKWVCNHSFGTRVPETDRTQVHGVMSNITGSRERRIRLGHHQALFEQYIATAAGGVWEIEFPREGDGAGEARRVHLSGRCKSFLGYEPQEFPDSMEAWQERIVPSDLSRVRQSARRHLQGAVELHEVEYRIRHRDGSLRWIHTRARVERDEQGRPRRWRGINWDVTDLQRRRDGREEREQGLARVLGAMRRGVVEVDLKGHIIYVNEALCEMLGYERAEVLGARTVDFCPTEEEREEMRCYFARMVRRRRPAEPYTTRRVCKDGSIRELQVEWDYRLGEKEEPVGFLGLVTDVTERAEAERDLLSRSRLEASATLAGGMAHKFNNLMVCVLGNAEILQNHHREHTDTVTMLASIAGAAREATDLVGSLLAYSRQGRRRAVSLDLNDLVDSVVRRERGGWSPEIEVSVGGARDLWSVSADRDQLERVVSTLCGNAVEALGTEGRIRIQTRNVVGGQGHRVDAGEPVSPMRWVRLTVEDDGIGMDDETRERVFEPFFSTKFQGRGLGLSAAYGIVQGQGGRISVESEPGRGCTITVDLPALPAAAEEE